MHLKYFRKQSDESARGKRVSRNLITLILRNNLFLIYIVEKDINRYVSRATIRLSASSPKTKCLEQL